MLLGLHEKRQGLHISINHFFVTFGCLGITLYLIFLQMDWRRSMVQSAAWCSRWPRSSPFRGPARARPGTPEAGRAAGFLKTQPVLAVLFVLAIFGVGIELGLTSFLPGFLLRAPRLRPGGSKVGLVLFLGGIASGGVLFGFISGRVRILLTARRALRRRRRDLLVLFFVLLPAPLSVVVFFLSGTAVSCVLPLLITLTGRLFSDMSGTALGIVKLGIPLGGIVVPSCSRSSPAGRRFGSPWASSPCSARGGSSCCWQTLRMIRAKLEGHYRHRRLAASRHALAALRPLLAAFRRSWRHSAAPFICCALLTRWNESKTRTCFHPAEFLFTNSMCRGALW